MGGIKMNYRQSSLAAGLDRISLNVGKSLLMNLSTRAVEIEAKMKRDRPWTDQTGIAKATLNAKVSQPNDHTVRLTLAHGVDYGIWLELAHNRNYAIVAPTLEQEAPRIIKDMGNVIANLKL